MGRLEGCERGLGKDVLNSHHDAECRDLDCPRPYARDSPSRQLRPVARSGNAECRSRVRTVEAMRCLADAVLSGQHADQSHGE